ncbi:hypothetical protein LZ32DRAFT_163652 [Colletotrichum eremochloae]|nr:hypothetical protein LZ32DRAFT_163652 [Colletotrichum eremochloae]
MPGPKGFRSSRFLLAVGGFCWTRTKYKPSSVHPFSGNVGLRPSAQGTHAAWVAETGDCRWAGPPDPGQSLQHPFGAQGKDCRWKSVVPEPQRRGTPTILPSVVREEGRLDEGEAHAAGWL